MSKGRQESDEVLVHVKPKGIFMPESLHTQVVHKMQKLDRYLDRLQEIEVELSSIRTRDAGQTNRVEASTRVAGKTIRVVSEDAEMMAAIDGAVDRLHRQLNRRKERIKSHHPHGRANAPESTSGEEILPTADFGDENETETEGPVVVVERLEMKPQFEEEAIEELAALGRAFHVFLNAQSEQINVLYRRSDGALGLIEPGR